MLGIEVWATLKGMESRTNQGCETCLGKLKILMKNCLLKVKPEATGGLPEGKPRDSSAHIGRLSTF